MSPWGQEETRFSARSAAFARGIASHDVLNDVINGLDAELFWQCFSDCDSIPDADHKPEIVAIDGKTSE